MSRKFIKEKKSHKYKCLLEMDFENERRKNKHLTYRIAVNGNKKKT